MQDSSSLEVRVTHASGAWLGHSACCWWLRSRLVHGGRLRTHVQVLGPKAGRGLEEERFPAEEGMA